MSRKLIENKLEVHLDTDAESKRTIEEQAKAIKDLSEALDEMTRKFEQANSRMESYKYQLNNLNIASGLATLQQEVKNFEQMATQSTYELNEFLRTVNLIGSNDWGADTYRFSELFEQVQSGCITASQAIHRVKMDYAALLEENYRNSSGAFDTQIISQFSSTLEKLGATVDSIHEKIVRLETEGVKTSGGGSGGNAGDNGLSRTIDAIAQAAERMELSSEGAVEKITNLVYALSTYAQVDETKMLAVTQAFRHMAELHTGSFSSKSVDNIINLAKRLKELNDTGFESFRFNVGGLKDFKVSSTLHYLNEFMEKVTSDQIANLERLQRINLSNLSKTNLSFDKRSITNIIDLFNALSQQQHNFYSSQADYSMYDQMAQSADHLEQEIREETEAFEAEKAVSKEHNEGMTAAAESEATKMAASEKLTSTLYSELDAIKQVAGAAKADTSDEWHTNMLSQAQDIGKTTAALLEYTLASREAAEAEGEVGRGMKNDQILAQKAVLGKYSAWVKEFSEKIKGLNFAPKDLLQNLQELAQYADKLESATTPQERSSAYQRFDVLLDTIRVKLAAETAEEKNLNAAAKETIRTLEQAANIEKMLINGSFEAHLRSLEKDLEGMSVKSNDLIMNFNDLKSSLADMQKAQDMDSLISAYERYNDALSGVLAVKRADKKDSGVYDKEQKDIQKVTDSIELYKLKIQGLETEISKFGINASGTLKSELTNIKSLLETMSSDKASNKDKIEAYQKLGEAIKVVTERLREEQKAYKDISDNMSAQTSLQKLLNQVRGSMSTAESKGVPTGSYQGIISDIENLITVAKKGSLSISELREKYAELVLRYAESKGAAEESIRAADQMAEARKREADAVEYAKQAANSYEDITAKIAKLGEGSDKTKLDGFVESLKTLNDQMQDPNTGAEQKIEIFKQFKSVLGDAEREVKKLSDAEKDAERKRREENSSLIEKTKLIGQAEALLHQVTSAQDNWTKAANNPATSGAYNQLAKYKDELTKMIAEYKQGSISSDKFKADLARLRGEFNNSKAAITSAGAALKGYFSRGLQQLGSRLSYTFGLAAIVYKTVAEIKKMVSTAVELDTAMTQLQIVTRASTSDMEAYAQSVSRIAKETSQSTKDLIDTATVFARLGYTMKESSILSTATAKLQAVGDIDASTAQDAITAIVKAFDKSVDEVEMIMDKLVVVGNNFPISVSQIAEGVNNAGSMLAMAGNSIEQTIALLTAANTTVQNISKSSTGLRTIAARIRKEADTLNEMGEDFDEDAYQNMIDVLKEQGLTLTKANGEFRSTYDILKDLASVWNDLTSIEQNMITTTIAGTRQQNVFASLIGQFQEAEGAMDAMEDSVGEMDAAFSLYKNSIQGHINEMKAAFDELSMALLNEDFAKDSIDFLKDILEILTALVRPIADLTGVLGPFFTLFTAGGIGLLIKNFGQPSMAA